MAERTDRGGVVGRRRGDRSATGRGQGGARTRRSAPPGSHRPRHSNRP